MAEATTGRGKTAAYVAGAGGLIAAIAAFLSWATVSLDLSSLGAGSQSESFTGISTGGRGYAVLAAGIVAIIAAIVYLLAGARSLRMAMGVLALLAGLVAAGLAIWSIVQVETQALDALAEEIGAEGAAFIEAFDVNVSTGFGLYLAVLGGLLAIVGGILALMAARSEPAMAMPEPGMAPPGAEGTPGMPAPGTTPGTAPPPPGGTAGGPPPPPPGGPPPPPPGAGEPTP